MSSSDWWNIKWYTKSGTKDLNFGAHSGGAANSSKFRIYTKSEKRKKKKKKQIHWAKKKKKKEREKCP